MPKRKFRSIGGKSFPEGSGLENLDALERRVVRFLWRTPLRALNANALRTAFAWAIDYEIATARATIRLARDHNVVVRVIHGMEGQVVEGVPGTGPLTEDEAARYAAFIQENPKTRRVWVLRSWVVDTLTRLGYEDAPENEDS